MKRMKCYTCGKDTLILNNSNVLYLSFCDSCSKNISDEEFDRIWNELNKNGMKKDRYIHLLCEIKEDKIKVIMRNPEKFFYIPFEVLMKDNNWSLEQLKEFFNDNRV